VVTITKWRSFCYKQYTLHFVNQWPPV